MMRRYFSLLMVSVLLVSCASSGSNQTLASLNKVEIDIQDEEVEGTLDKAMEAYRRFLAETPNSAMTPEALRRLADLKLEKDFGVIIDKEGQAVVTATPEQSSPPKVVTSVGKSPEMSEQTKVQAMTTPIVTPVPSKPATPPIAQVDKESQQQFEKRATGATEMPASDEDIVLSDERAGEQQIASAQEAVELYNNLLEKYPLYERNDQVLYQLSRAYEELGKLDEAMVVLNRLVTEYPRSRHIDEAQFRRAEYFFTRKRYLDAEEAYQAVLKIGVSSAFYELALYKQGWTYFKQEMYEQALDDFIGLLDHKLATGYDFEQTSNQIEKKRMDDTYRVISLSFSNLGGANAIVDYFNKNGNREYEMNIYSHLGEHYLSTRRYADAAEAYLTYVKLNPLNKVAPQFHMRVIEIYREGGFPKLVVDSKREFAVIYAPDAKYWSHFYLNSYPDVLAFIKTNLIDLAGHYHALYQDKRHVKEKEQNYREASHWYQVYLQYFPQEIQAPQINFQLAELLLENRGFRDAARQYERTAYQYSRHEKSSAAGYSAVYAYREYLKEITQAERAVVKQEIIRSSLKFFEYYPEHEKAPIVLAAATEDMFEMHDFASAIKTGRKFIERYPEVDVNLRRSTWLVVAHASFELTEYADAEQAYTQVLALTDKQSKEREDLTENLAAAIYKQGEQSLKLADFQSAAGHFLRVATVTPTAKIRSTAEYDGAAALISLQDWKGAAEVLTGFRQRYPNHELQPEVTKKLAVVYKSDGRWVDAAHEFERIERETKDQDVRREALLAAAELYEQAKEMDMALAIYQRYVNYFDKPLEFIIETEQKISEIYRAKNDITHYTQQLQRIVDADARAGLERTDRTRYLAAKAALVLAEPMLAEFESIRLVKPFEKNLQKKRASMKVALNAMTKLVDYQVGEVTAAATHQIAGIYLHFSQALMHSERPTDLNEQELEQYELALEEQAYPFEEKGISIYEKNLELMAMGIYNTWIEESLKKLSTLVPARYARNEMPSYYALSITK